MLGIFGQEAALCCEHEHADEFSGCRVLDGCFEGSCDFLPGVLHVQSSFRGRTRIANRISLAMHESSERYQHKGCPHRFTVIDMTFLAASLLACCHDGQILCLASIFQCGVLIFAPVSRATSILELLPSQVLSGSSAAPNHES